MLMVTLLFGSVKGLSPVATLSPPEAETVFEVSSSSHYLVNDMAIRAYRRFGTLVQYS